MSISEAYVKVQGSSAFLVNSRFSEYRNSFSGGHDPTRQRRLLLHKGEALRISQAVAQKGLTCVPLRVYFNEDGRVKVEIGVGRGKDGRDRRRDIQERDGKREVRNSEPGAWVFVGAKAGKGAGVLSGQSAFLLHITWRELDDDRTINASG